ncbi:hypothetical protein ACQ33O_06195 [Ferruginibacter sp. SUN002]|uniref:hypothetical protein n=1 Tax=Ferruginibacter sp. SUN002 TaxID=2937789 RepID=UPI003D367BF0
MIKNIIIFAFTSLVCQSCVQKTYKKTVVYILKVENQDGIKKVGIRGNDAPLNWQYDFEMKQSKSDSGYVAVVTYLTGYKFTESKFVVNDEFEFPNQDNRKIVFSDKDTTIYTGKFNIRN